MTETQCNVLIEESSELIYYLFVLSLIVAQLIWCLVVPSLQRLVYPYADAFIDWSRSLQGKPPLRELQGRLRDASGERASMKAWNMSVQLAQLPTDYLDHVPAEVAGLIRDLTGLHQDRSTGGQS